LLSQQLAQVAAVAVLLLVAVAVVLA